MRDRHVAPAPRSVVVPRAASEAVSGPGSPLPEDVRSRMERGFGEDLSDVRVHTDAAAQRGAVGSSAQALTVGDRIAFGPGATPGDSRLLAHELAHVVQQRHSAGSAAPGSAPALESAADAAGDRVRAGGRVGKAGGGAVPAVQLTPVKFGAGSVLVVVNKAAVTVNGVAIRATVGPDGRLSYNNREIVLDRSGVFRYRDRYTVCRPCNPDYYEAPRWTKRAGTAIPETVGSFYDPITRSWVLRSEPIMTEAVLTPLTPTPGVTPGPVNPQLQQRVEMAQRARQEFESRVEVAMENGRSRAEAEALVRSRMQESVGESGLGAFESGQTYAIVEEEIAPGVTRRTTTGAVAGGAVPTVPVSLPQVRARLATINQALGENFEIMDRNLLHAEIRAIVHNPHAGTYYATRDMCSSCQRFYLMEARAQGRPITVVDPMTSTSRVFSPDLTITEVSPTTVYQRTGAITRKGGVSDLEIGKEPSVTHSVRMVPRESPLPEPAAPEGTGAGTKAPAAEPHVPAGTPRASGAVAEPEPPGGPARTASAGEPEPHVPRPLEAPKVRPGVIEPGAPVRAGGIGPRASGIRRFGVAAGRVLAEGLLTVALLLFEVIIQLIVIPYLERLRQRLEAKYREMLQREIQEYYDRRLAGVLENRVLRMAETLRRIEDNDEQPYVNTTLRVHFKRAWSFWTGPQYGRPESITDLDFVSIELLQTEISSSPVEESSDELVADDPGFLLGERRATEWSQVVRFPAIPPSYQELVRQFGEHPASRAKLECFMATACYGTPYGPALDTLRAFRDGYLDRSPRGRRLVDLYYRTSPPVADFLRCHAVARWAVRLGFVAPLAHVVRLFGLDRRTSIRPLDA